MEVLSVAEAREQFSELMAKVAYGGQRVLIERRGRPMVVWISIEDLHRLERLEQDTGERKAARQLALTQATASRQRIQMERHGALLPDAAEVVARLREERTDELTGLR